MKLIDDYLQSQNHIDYSSSSIFQPQNITFNHTLWLLYHIKLLRMSTLSVPSSNNKSSQPPSESIVQQHTKSTTPNQQSIAQSSVAQSATSAYLSRLLQRHTTKANFVLSFTTVKEQQCEEEIINGRYNIHKRDWSAEEERLKASRTDPSRNTNTNEIQHAKRQLEEELEQIEGQIEENERSGKSMSDEERKAFLKRMEKEKKELIRKKEENARLLEERRMEEERKERQQQQREENDRKVRKQQQIAQRIRALEQQRRRKEQQNRSQTVLLKQKLREKTAASRIEENYNIKQNETLQQRKKRLAEIRMLHKPIDRKELDAHAQKMDQLHAERAAAALAAAATEAEKNGEKQLAFYKSIFYKRVKEEPKVYLDRQSEEEVSKLRENRDKLKKFAQHIRENYKPTIDQKKAQQIRFRSVNMRNRSLSTAKAQDPQKIGLRYLEFSKQQVQHQRLLGVSHEEQPEEEKAKKTDYLAELRKNNRNRASESAHQLLNKLQRGAVSKEEKMKKILQFTDRIEKTAKRKQQLSKITSGAAVDDQLDALYLEAIEAKLGLLDDF